MQQRIAVDGGNHRDIAAIAAIAAAGSAARDVLLAPEREAAIAAIARLNGDDYFIYEQSLLDRFDADELANPAAIAKLDNAGDLGEQGVVFAPAHVLAGLEGCAALPDNDGTAGHQLTAKHLHTEPLRVGIAPVFGTA
jgi:hypothetical protein